MIIDEPHKIIVSFQMPNLFHVCTLGIHLVVSMANWIDEIYCTKNL